MNKKSIFLISHSIEVTDGIKHMIEQMQISKDVTIYSLGGTSDGELGSDATKIIDAAVAAKNDDAILVFADVGSAVLNAELAKDMLSEELQKKYYLVNSSLVEGAFAAAITAGITDDIDEIINEAKQAHVKEWN